MLRGGRLPSCRRLLHGRQAPPEAPCPECTCMRASGSSMLLPSAAGMPCITLPAAHARSGPRPTLVSMLHAQGEVRLGVSVKAGPNKDKDSTKWRHL